MQGLVGEISVAGVTDTGADDIEPDEEKVTVPLNGGGPPTGESGAPAPPSESINLLEKLTGEEQAKISARVIDDYDEDVKSRESHMRMVRRWYELYAGVLKVKNWPFQGCANVNVPLLTYAVLQVHGRLFDMLLPAKGNIYSSQPTRVTDEQEVDRATRTELFVNWYIREKIPEYRMSYDATFWQTLIFGSAFRYFWWDSSENRVCAEWIGIDDMVVPYQCKVTDPSMRGVPRYTLRRHMTLYEIQDRGDKGEYLNTEGLKPETSEGKNDSEVREAVDEVDGKERPTRQFLEDEDRDVLEQHRWLRLPDDIQRDPSFDGKHHPVVITCDEASRKVLRVVLREEDDPTDAKRFAKEKAAFDASQAPPPPAQVGPDGMPLPAPPPPPPAPEPKPARKREICFFTHYQAFQGEGFYGLGFGNFLGPMNEAMNTMLNQHIDRATVNNAGGGLISRQIRFQRGPIVKEPGQYTEVDAPPAALKDGLVPWPQVNPDPEGRWHIQYVEQMANRVSGAGDTLSGEPIGSNETARAAMNRNEQAQKQITVLAGRIIGYMTCDARILWRLFSVYLNEEEYHEVADSAGKPRQIQIGRQDFIADARVVPTADARVTSQAQRVGDAQNFFQFVCANEMAPELMQNPAMRRAAIEQVLYAMDRHEVLELLGPPPGPPQPPPPRKQWEENAGFLTEKDQPTNPQDDDDEHLVEMQMFKADPLGYGKLTPTGKKMADNHERGHFAQKMTKERQADEQRRQAAAAAIRGPVGGGPPGMAGPPANGPPGGYPPGQ